jgi:ERCC4-type nuclease
MQPNEAEKRMALRALRNALIVQAVKWTLIIVCTRSLKKAVERELARRNGHI